jgi:hypothetical protein
VTPTSGLGRTLTGVATATLLISALWGCGSERGADDGSNSSSGNDAGHSASASGGSLNIGGSSLQGNEGDGVGDTCAGERVSAKPIPLDMFLMVDVSGSMLAPTESDPNTTKWQAVQRALESFFMDPDSSGIGVGLQFFPHRHPDAPASCTTHQACGDFGPCLLSICWNFEGVAPCASDADCGIFGPCITFGECELDRDYQCPVVGANCNAPPGVGALGECLPAAPSLCLSPTDCRPATYAAPVAPVAELPGAQASLLDAVAQALPKDENLTPTGAALDGAIQGARTHVAAHPDRQVVTVLATDGLPTQCEPLEIPDVAALARSAAGATPSIPTFVIGVIGPEEPDAPENLDAIALAGGTQTAFIIDTQANVAEQFGAALAEIRAARLACEFAIPEADGGRAVDYDRVNVEFTDGNGRHAVYYVESAAGCDSADGGWFYDTDPRVEAPSRIVACPVTCSAFADKTASSVEIKLGCRTVVK